MNTISGLSFYDSLNKMTIGTLVLLLVKDMPSEDDGKSIFLFIVAAFIIGCIFQMVVQFITGNTVLGNRIKTYFKTTWIHQCSCLYLISVWLNWTNNSAMIKDAHDRVYKSKEYIQDIDRLYLQAYYRVARNGLLMNIPILEALENFMRNLIFYFMLLTIFPNGNILPILSCETISVMPDICKIFIEGIILFGILLLIIIVSILFYECLKKMLLCICLRTFILCGIIMLGIFLCGNSDSSTIGLITVNCRCKLILCFCVVCILYWLRKEIQYKIHYLIWEGDYYIRRLDKERNKA